MAILERPTYHHGDLRNALVRAAIELVDEEGIDAFSLRAASRRVGVSPSASYRHFRDRRALLRAVADDGFERLGGEMLADGVAARAGLGEPAAAVAALSATLRAYVLFAVRQRAQFRVMFGPWAMPAIATGDCEPHDKKTNAAYLALAGALDGLVTAGVIPATARERLELVAWAPMHGLARLLIDGLIPTDAATLDASFSAIERPLLIGLGVDPSLLVR